jgi:homocysteine S-methyltransferase
MSKAETPEAARAEGIAIAREALAECIPMSQGVYVMPPFADVSAALEVIESVPEELRGVKTIES